MTTVRWKPILVTPANYPTVAQAAWAKALLMQKFGYAEISTAMCISIVPATRIVRSWIKERSVEQINPERAGSARALWRCLPDFVRIEPLRVRTPEENMWFSIRKLRGGFSHTDIAAHASNEMLTVSVSDAGEYCRALLAAEYLVVASKADPVRKREAIYRLIHESGVQPPMVKRVRAVVDPNIGATIVIGGGL